MPRSPSENKVKPGAPVWKVEWVYGENLNRRLVCLFQKLRPALLKELPHVMTSSTNVWIVFIEFFTVIKHQVDVNDESLEVLIPEIRKKTKKNKNILLLVQLTQSWCIPYCSVTKTHFLRNTTPTLNSVQRPRRLSLEERTNRSEGNLLAAHKLLTYGGEVHRFLDDLPVAGDRFQVDGCEKRPCILMPLQLSKENPDGSTNTHTYTHS